MARIAGVDLPRTKRINIGLTYIYGIGVARSARILDEAKVDPMKKIQDLGEDEVNRIRQVIESEGLVEGDLRKEVSMNIKRLIEIGSYRGYRHRRNLKGSAQRHGGGEEEDGDKDLKASLVVPLWSLAGFARANDQRLTTKD